MIVFLVVLFSVMALAQPAPVDFEGRPALVLANDKLALTMLPQGGAFVSIVLVDDPEKLNPMWNPARMARELSQKPTFGSSMGHFVCVDGFGGVSPEEQAAGLQGHGEAHRLPWKLESFDRSAGTVAASFSVQLPLLQEIFRRTVRIPAGEQVVYVDSELESLVAFDRPVVWAEHATIGSPFLEAGKTVVDMSAQRAKTRPYRAGGRGLPHRLASAEDFTWPMAPGAGGNLIDVRSAPSPPNSGDHTTSLMDTSRRLVFVTALHPEKRLLLGYIFRREEFPWTQSWEFYPPTEKLARGLEFSTQPFDVPRREAIQTNSLFGAPTYRWLPAKSKITSRFLFFLTRAPEGMGKVDDVRMETGQIVIEDRSAGKQIALRASVGL
jgi:hypothetical protein